MAPLHRCTFLRRPALWQADTRLSSAAAAPCLDYGQGRIDKEYVGGPIPSASEIPVPIRTLCGETRESGRKTRGFGRGPQEPARVGKSRDGIWDTVNVATAILPAMSIERIRKPAHLSDRGRPATRPQAPPPSQGPP